MFSITFLILSISIYSLSVDRIFLLLIIIPILILYGKSVKIRKIILSIGIIFIILLSWYFLKNINIFSYLPTVNLKNIISGWIDKKYNEKTSAVLNMLLLNKKVNSYSYDFSKQLNLMSVGYMICVSGMQISFVNLIINKIIKKKKLAIAIQIIFVLSYAVILNFPPGFLRILLCLFLMKMKNKYEKLSLSGLIIMLINPNYITNFGFCLSYLCCFGIYVVVKYKFNNWIIESLAINLVCTLVSAPFCFKMDSSFDLMSLIYGIVLVYPFLFEFIFSLFTFWIVPLHSVQDFVINCFIDFTTYTNIFNLTIVATNIKSWMELIYWFMCFIIMHYINKRTIYNERRNA